MGARTKEKYSIWNQQLRGYRGGYARRTSNGPIVVAASEPCLDAAAVRYADI
jgi:hypothetical protein